jgi:hypothetical protein
MEIPFLKNKHKKNDGGGGPIPTQHVSPDGKSDSALMDDVAQELLSAIEKKDVRALRQSLEALVLHIQDADAMSDEMGIDGL